MLPSRIRNGTFAVPTIVFAIGIIATVLAAFQAARIVRSKDVDRVQHLVSQAQDAIQARMETYVAMLRAGAGMVSAQEGQVSREYFRRFVQQLQLNASFPGVQGIGLSVRLTTAPGEDPRTTLRAYGQEDLALTPSGERQEIHAIVHLEPLDPRNAAALGYDMFSEPTRRAAMEQARDTGSPTASGRVHLVQETAVDQQAGFLIYVPVYRGGTVPATVEQRRQQLLGFVYSPFRADDLMRGIFGSSPRPRLNLELYDGELTEQNLLHRSEAQMPTMDEARYMDVQTLQVAGRTWGMRYETRPEFEFSSGKDLIPYLLIGGLLMSSLLAGLTAAQSRARMQADHAAARAQGVARKLDVLNKAAARLSGELDAERLLQEITDTGCALSGADGGVFFQQVSGAPGRQYAPAALSGTRAAALVALGLPHQTDCFATMLRTGSICSGDLTTDVRFTEEAGWITAARGTSQVRSYLAVPVTSRAGIMVGVMCFGHADADVFSREAERSIIALAGHAAIAIDNARLFQASQEEIAARKQIEEHQKFLLDELNHRVKNTLATVQSIAAHTLRSSPEPAAFRRSFEARLLALSEAHNLLSQGNWRGVTIEDLVRRELAPHGLEDPQRIDIEGDRVWVPPSVAVPLGMALHELATNAARHGAFKSPEGRLQVRWSATPTAAGVCLRFTWQESGGPPVVKPRERGFGARLIERGLRHDLQGRATLHFEPGGLRCEIEATVPARAAVA